MRTSNIAPSLASLRLMSIREARLMSAAAASVFPSYFTKSCSGCFTVRTGQGASRTTFSAVEPNTK